MFLSNLSIKRPIFATMMMLALVILGIFSYRRLAIDLMPDVEIPVLSIVTVFPGASPETVEREVTKRIEEEVNRISGAKHVSSISRESVSQVVVEFQLEVKITKPLRMPEPRSTPSARIFPRTSKNRSFKNLTLAQFRSSPWLFDPKNFPPRI